jgi:hypothetical protein
MEVKMAADFRIPDFGDYYMNIAFAGREGCGGHAALRHTVACASCTGPDRSQGRRTTGATGAERHGS